MATIYVIKGGGQKIRQNIQMDIATEYHVNQNSNWPNIAKASGSDSFTNVIWSTDLKTLQKWANDWAGEVVELIKADEQHFS